MKILMVGTAYPWALENWYFNAFVRLGMTVDRFSVENHGLLRHDPTPSLPRRAADRLLSPVSDAVVRRTLLAYLENRNYDLVLVFKGMWFDLGFLEKCRAVAGNARWINYYPDDPMNLGSRGSSNAKIVKAIPFFDLYLIWTPRLIPALESRGAKRVACLPFGFDSEAHRPLAGIIEASPCFVSFVGAWDREREAILTSLADFDLRIYGENWHRIAYGSPLQRRVFPGNVFGSELARIIGESAVSLNLLRNQNSGAHNMRSFEIPAMGGVALTTRSEEQQKWFPEGEAALMFSEPNELRAGLERLLADIELRRKLRMEGLKRVAPHTYDARVARLLELIN